MVQILPAVTLLRTVGAASVTAACAINIKQLETLVVAHSAQNWRSKLKKLKWRDAHHRRLTTDGFHEKSAMQLTCGDLTNVSEELPRMESQQLLTTTVAETSVRRASFFGDTRSKLKSFSGRHSLSLEKHKLLPNSFEPKRPTDTIEKRKVRRRVNETLVLAEAVLTRNRDIPPQPIHSLLRHLRHVILGVPTMEEYLISDRLTSAVLHSLNHCIDLKKLDLFQETLYYIG